VPAWTAGRALVDCCGVAGRLTERGAAVWAELLGCRRAVGGHGEAPRTDMGRTLPHQARRAAGLARAPHAGRLRRRQEASQGARPSRCASPQPCQHRVARLAIRFCVGCPRIIPMVIHTILLDPSGSIWTDEASNVSRPDPSGAVQVDAEHPPRNRRSSVRIRPRALKLQVRACGRSSSCSPCLPRWSSLMREFGLGEARPASLRRSPSNR
jgi:hypothetical protein